MSVRESAAELLGGGGRGRGLPHEAGFEPIITLGDELPDGRPVLGLGQPAEPGCLGANRSGGSLLPKDVHGLHASGPRSGPAGRTCSTIRWERARVKP